MLSNHLILCHPLLLPSIFLSIRVFSDELALRIRWPKYWNFSISPYNECSGLISFRINWYDSLQFKGLSRVFSSTTVWKHQFFSAQPSLWSNSLIHTWLLEKLSLTRWTFVGKVKSLSRVRLLETSWTAAYQAPPSVGFSRQEYWSGVPLPSPSLVLSFLYGPTLTSIHDYWKNHSFD